LFVSKNDRAKELVAVEPEIKRQSDVNEAEFLIHDALQKLNGKHREIINLALRNAGSSKEIANILKIPIATARTRLFYAKQKMKKLIETHAHQSNIKLPYHR
jgi:RNA polymerase sigma-70 factor (ECF subfamily)